MCAMKPKDENAIEIRHRPHEIKTAKWMQRFG